MQPNGDDEQDWTDKNQCNERYAKIKQPLEEIAIEFHNAMEEKFRENASADLRMAIYLSAATNLHANFEECSRFNI